MINRDQDHDDDRPASVAAANAEVVPPHEILAQFANVNIAAPMVRYSKLPFRHLVSLYDCHITHTPMILAKEFSRSAIARASDFSTSADERGMFWLNEKRATLSDSTDDGHHKPRRRLVRGALVAQFAASDPKHLADAAELISPYCDGIDLNCGCPQSWAYQEHVGSWLLREPDVVRDIVRATKDRLGWNYPVSIKIRVDNDLRQTDTLVKTAINAGVSHISVHGRTRLQASTQPVSLPAIRAAVDMVNGVVPVVANGDAWSTKEVELIRTTTSVQGVMSARGLLANPALFSGYETTPPDAVKNFVRIAVNYGGLPFALFHRHLAYMLEARFQRAERTFFNSLTSHAAIIDYLETRGLDLRHPLGL